MKSWLEYGLMGVVVVVVLSFVNLFIFKNGLTNGIIGSLIMGLTYFPMAIIESALSEVD